MERASWVQDGVYVVEVCNKWLFRVPIIVGVDVPQSFH